MNLSSPDTIADKRRLSTLPNALSTLSQIVEIFSLYQLLHGQTIPEFSFMHQQDADHVFNVRTPALMNIEELVMVTEEVILISII